jgi:hypothetical protein
MAIVFEPLTEFARAVFAIEKSCIRMRSSLTLHDCFLRMGLVEQCPFNSKRPILAIFSRFLFSLTIIAEPLILLAIFDFSMSSLVLS